MCKTIELFADSALNEKIHAVSYHSLISRDKAGERTGRLPPAGLDHRGSAHHNDYLKAEDCPLFGKDICNSKKKYLLSSGIWIPLFFFRALCNNLPGFRRQKRKNSYFALRATLFWASRRLVA